MVNYLIGPWNSPRYQITQVHTLQQLPQRAGLYYNYSSASSIYFNKDSFLHLFRSTSQLRRILSIIISNPSQIYHPQHPRKRLSDQNNARDYGSFIYGSVCTIKKAIPVTIRLRCFLEKPTLPPSCGPSFSLSCTYTSDIIDTIVEDIACDSDSYITNNVTDRKKSSILKEIYLW